ncbi:MAG: glycosyltransferase family 2 protein [Myxococcales bacterium]|nr:glycosyltransferase family 2 protein [Myxococcales bacterium]
MKVDSTWTPNLPLSRLAPEDAPRVVERPAALGRLVVVILTRNEEVNLGKALVSIGGRAPVIVVDSESTDRTAEIAAAAGAEFVVHRFVDYASQRNFAIQRVAERFEWLLFLDADEELTDEVWAEIDRHCARDDLDGVYFGRILRFFGHDLRHGGMAGHAMLRLMRPGVSRYDREINERVDDTHMRIAYASAKLIHDDRKPILDWLVKHVGYAEREATAYLSGRDDSLAGFSLRTQRSRTIGLRWAYNRLPLGMRPFAHFARTLLWQGAYKDGAAGTVYAVLQSLWYPMMIDMMIVHRRFRGESAALASG